MLSGDPPQTFVQELIGTNPESGIAGLVGFALGYFFPMFLPLLSLPGSEQLSLAALEHSGFGSLCGSGLHPQEDARGQGLRSRRSGLCLFPVALTND